MPGADRRLSRRALLAGAGAGVMARPGRAATVGFCVVGGDGWLFSVFDSVWQTDEAPMRAVTTTIAEAVGVLRAAKLEVALSITPAKSRVYRDFLPPELHWSAQADRRYELGLTALRRTGCVVPDQAAVFAQMRRERPGEDLFFRADTHWTGAGAAAAAAALGQQIRAQASLPRSAKPGPKLGAPGPVLQERNDLAALLPPEQRERYPLQSYTLRKPAAEDGAALLEDESADVVVIGNSFMQPAFGFPTELSAALDRPVGLSWKVHQFSPYWMLLSYLRSDAFKARRPRLIVWNFEEQDFEAPANTAGAWGQTAMTAAVFQSALRQTLGA